MPVYVYSCDYCNGVLERSQRFSDAPLTVCPSCGGSLRKVLQPVGVLFKGSGWYCTDNRPKASSESNGSGSSSNSEKADKSEPAAASKS